MADECCYSPFLVLRPECARAGAVGRSRPGLARLSLAGRRCRFDTFSDGGKSGRGECPAAWQDRASAPRPACPFRTVGNGVRRSADSVAVPSGPARMCSLAHSCGPGAGSDTGHVVARAKRDGRGAWCRMSPGTHRPAPLNLRFKTSRAGQIESMHRAQGLAYRPSVPHSQAAPRTPLESPCRGGTSCVSTRSENT